MKNIVNRALVAKKKQFLSKSVPRGTRTIWRYLGALFLLFTFAIGNVWADDYNLINDNDNASTATLNTDDFWTAQSLQAKSNGGDLKKCIILGGNISAEITKVSYPSRYISYGVKTTSVTITIKAYQSNNSAKKINIYEVNEAANGALTVTNTKEESVAKGLQTITFTASPAAGTRSTIYITSQAASNFEFYQVTASETGSALTNLVGGRDGYAIDYSKKSRLATKSGETAKLDGIEYYKLASDYKPNYTQKVVLKTGGYIKFNTIEPIVLTIVTTTAQKFYVAQTADGTTNPKEAADTHRIKLSAAGDWYIIGGSSSATDVSSIAFSVPTISYDKNDAGADGTMSSNTWTVAANGFTAPSGKKFDKWNTKADGSGDDVAVDDELLENTTLYAQWKADVEEYAITEATSLTGGSVDASAAIKAAGETVTITATPAFRYLFDAWDVYKTEDPTTKVSVTETAGVYTFEMPAYPVTVSATFAADSRKQILYLTSTNAENTKANDKLYAALNAEATYNVIIEAPASQTLTNYDLVVLHESIGGTSTADAVVGCKTTSVPVLNTKSFFYGATGDATKRWAWGDPNNGVAAQKEATLNVSYSNITEHPIFAGVTITTNKVKVLSDDVTSGNTMQPVEPVEGKKGYLLATTPNKESGVGYAIQEIPAGEEFRGATSGKYLLISVSNAGLNNLTTDGQKLFQNAAAYMMSATAWVPAAAADDDATLKALSVSGLTLSPTFAAATVDYTVTKAYSADDPVVSDVTATPTADGASAEVVWDGTNKKFVITVTAVDNTTTKEYTITVNEAAAPKSLSRVLFSNGFDAFIDNTNHIVKAYYLAGQAAPTATTITAGNGTAGEHAEGKITVTGEDASTVDYIVTLEAVTPNTTSVAEADPAGEFAGDEAWVKNGLLVYGNAAGYSAGDKWYVNRRLTKGTDPEDDQRVIAGWVRSYFFVGNASKFIMTVGGNKNLDYAIDGGTPVENVNVETLEIALTKGNHMIEIVSHQSSGDCRLSAPKLVELPASHTVTYMPGDGTGAWVVDDDAIEVADCPGTFTAPTGQVFNGWKDESDNDVEVGAAVTTDMALTAQWINHYAVTFNMNGHGETIDPQDIKKGAKATKPADPIAVGFDFGGWFTDNGTFEAPFDFNTPITAATPLFAKWTEFEGCALLYPALSGDALHEGDNVAVQTGSAGGSIAVVGMKEEGSISYNANGLFLSGGGADVISVTLNNDIAVGTKISVTLMAANTGSRGLNLLNATGGKVKGGTKLGWDDATLGEVGTFSYTVEASDGLEGTNIFRLQRNNSVYLQCVKVESCGAAITYHNLTSEVNIAGKGTVTLGASVVREGYTTTATYSEIDPLYEFVNWTVSGAGASIADASANPATITMGTEDAVVTLNLQLIPVKFTVNYFDGTTAMGTELVPVNENPTASEIKTAKRHYTFLGWSLTDGGDIVALNTITRTEATTVDLFAKYEAIACPTSGTIFSMEFDETKKPGETVTIAKDASIDLAEYATISGGNAMIINGETSGKDAISTDGEFLLKATKEVMKIELNCVLQEGDIIRIPDNSAKLVISTSNAKTGTYQAFADKNTHEFAVTAAWAGVDDIYVLYDGSSLKFTKVYVIRPAKYDVSFNMMGHGTQIADIEDVLEGSKITAPTAPTDADYSFAGWYKENTLANEWKFDVDVVEANTTLYAKWLDKSDATLKSLKYGAEEIALQAGVYTYNVELPALTTAVPALTAETSNPNATKVITDATAFDAEGHATSKVVVTPEKVGAATQTYTVNFAKAASVALQDVTGSITWDFNGAVTADVNINNTLTVISNYAGVSLDGADKLEVKGTKFMKSPACVRANQMHFYTTVPGKLTVEYSNTGGSNPVRYLYVNGVKYDETGTESTAKKGEDTKVFVPAGDVELVMMDGSDASKELNIYRIIFNATPDYKRNVSNNIGTLCVDHNVPAGQYFGATFYQIVGRNQEYSYKIDFEEVMPNEELKAGEPYIFQSTTGRIDLFYGETEAENPVPVRGMIGNYAASHLDITEVNKADILYISQNKLWTCEDLVGVGLTLNEHRCYIKMSDVPEQNPGQQNNVRRRVTLGRNAEQVATGCENLNVSDKPVKRIINGQLFILRGEKMYDAKGQLVK